MDKTMTNRREPRPDLKALNPHSKKSLELRGYVKQDKVNKEK